MTTVERFRKIEENLLVQSHLVAVFERETKARLEAVEAQVDRHEQANRGVSRRRCTCIWTPWSLHRRTAGRRLRASINSSSDRIHR